MAKTESDVTDPVDAAGSTETADPAGPAEAADPAEAAARRAQADELASELTAAEIEAVALTWVDNAGLTRTKTVPTIRLGDVVETGVGMSPVFDVFCVDDSITTSAYIGGPVDDLRLFPALDQIVRLAAQPGWAWAPVDRYSQDGAPHTACSRLYAKRMAEAASAAGLEFSMAFETEWCLWESAGDGSGLRPAVSGPAYGMTRVIELSDYLRDLLRALAAQGIPIDQLHPEYANGQFELSVGATDPVAAADRAVLVRETIRAVSLKYKLHPTFAPAVEVGNAGNGWHVHLSAWSEGENQFAGGNGPYGMRPRGQAILATLLSHLPALSAITAPSVSSRMRLVPQRWAGPYQCWGWENREAGLRFVTGSTGRESTAANVEVKCVDGSANPYLAVGALCALATAADPAATLPPEISVDPATMHRDDQPPRLPLTVDDAIRALRADAVLVDSLGAPLLESFIAVHEAEVAMFSGVRPEAVADATRWRY